VKYFIGFIVALGLTFGTVSAPAEATRSVPGFHYKDECKNIPGKQPAYLLVGTGPYRRVPGTHRKCYVRDTGKGHAVLNDGQFHRNTR
jgi:hypothetical protein